MLEFARQPARMDAIRTTLINAVAARGFSLTALSKLAGKNDAYAQQFVNRGTPKVLPDDVRRCWAIALNIDERSLGARAPYSPICIVPTQNAYSVRYLTNAKSRAAFIEIKSGFQPLSPH